MPDDKPEPGCLLCARESAGYEPPGGWVWRDEHWGLGLLEQNPVPGWLVLQARTHIEGLWELPDGAADSLGPLLASASTALHEETGCERVYLVSFGEGIAHWHVLLQARPDGLAPESKGPNLISHAAEFVDPDQAAHCAAAVGKRLANLI